jgi:hypothetical protein
MTKDEEKIIKMLRNKEEIMSLERFRHTVQKIKVIEIKTEHSKKKKPREFIILSLLIWDCTKGRK